MRVCERKNSADTKVSEKGGGMRCLKYQSRDSFLAAHAEDHGKAGCFPAVHGGPRWSRHPPVAHGRDAGAGRCPKEAVTLWEARVGASSCQDL